MPSLLLVNQYFWPDVAATAQLLSDLAEDAAKAGWKVTALTGRGHYISRFRQPLPGKESWKGVDIVRVPCTSFGRLTMAGRMADYLTFFASAGFLAFFGRRNDIVVCLSTPPMVALLGVIAKLRGSHFVYKVEDLYPDVAVALGVLRENSLATKFLRGASRFILGRADACVALDDAMAVVLKDHGAKSVTVIPNWADGEALRPDELSGREYRQEEGIAERSLVVLYSGNLGLAHRFDEIVHAAKVLSEKQDQVLFLFVGDGPRLGSTRDSAQGLPNVRFSGPVPRKRLRGLYNAADVHVVTLREEVSGLLVPSKYSAALAAGKPVILVGGQGSEMSEEIRREGIGVTVASGDDIVRWIDQMLEGGSALTKEAGLKGRALFDRKYCRGTTSESWLLLLANLSGHQPARRPTQRS